MNRAEFLRLTAAAGVGAVSGALPGLSRNDGAAADALPMPERRDQAAPLPGTAPQGDLPFVFDGVVNLGLSRGARRWEGGPGAIKRATGIDVGNHNVRITTMAAWAASLDDRDGVLRIDRFSDIERATRAVVYGVVVYVQSNLPLTDSVEPLAEWKEAGLRALQLTYVDNALGGGSGNDERGLTPFGHRAVRELERLRMLVDVSHCGRRTTLDAAAAASRPITANHLGAARLTPHSRNKSDEELRAIAATGGVVGVTAINRFFLRDTARPGTLEDFVAHVEHIVDLVGVDHVGVSTDGYIDGTHRYEVDFSSPEINGPDRWRHVAARLRDRGYGRDDVAKVMGGNFLRVYREVLDP